MYEAQIRKHRMDRGLSQQELGELLGISSAAVSKWERGQSAPDVDMLARLADAFGISMDELCGHEPPPTPESNFAVMTRAFIRLTPEEQRKFLDVGRALFAHAFEREAP